MNILRGINGALALLTTLPTFNAYPQQPGAAYAFFPLVGVLIGGLLWGIHHLTTAFIAPDSAAFVVLLAWVLLTGGLHLDGFGDACDGLFAQVDPARRLDIMKDSRAGSWAVVGLVLLLLAKWLALRDVAPAEWVLVTVSGRWVMVAVAVLFPYARQQGMGGYFRQGLGPRQLIGATAIFVVVGLFYWQNAPVIVAVLAAAVSVAVWASRRLGGGLTGDIYGALCELTEVLMLFALNST